MNEILFFTVETQWSKQRGWEEICRFKKLEEAIAHIENGTRYAEHRVVATIVVYSWPPKLDVQADKVTTD